MTELLPCPFCGGEAELIDMTDALEAEYWVAHQCPSGASVETYSYETATEAIAAWNSRAERTCHADEVTHRNCKYSINRGWREWTCEEYGSVRVWQSCNVWSHELSCGHEVDTLDKEPPNYCPNCGAKVVGE